MSGSFGGLLAAAIGNMAGIGGKEGWAWIFILEGLATVLVGIASFWMVFDFPDEAKFLSAEDKQRVIRRLKACILEPMFPLLELNDECGDTSWGFSLAGRVLKLAIPPQTSRTDSEIVL